MAAGNKGNWPYLFWLLSKCRTQAAMKAVIGVNEPVTEHDGLTGLGDDDHTQYHNDARGDARYSLLGHGHAISDTTGLQTALDLKAPIASPTFTGTVTLPAATVTLAMMADVSTSTVFYRKTAGTGVPEVQTLATLKTDLGLTGTNSGDQTITLTTDVTGSGTGSFAATIAAGAVTLAKMADLATARFIGRVTAGTGAPEAMTGTQATTLLDTFTSGLKGLAPASGGGTTNFLRADGAWAAPAGGPGGGGSGTATINFGAFPGGSDASVAVTGQTGIVGGSIVQAWLSPAATADHTADEHLVETIKVFAGNIVAGTGFTIYALNTSQLNEPLAPFKGLTGTLAGQLSSPPTYLLPTAGGKGTRIYGQWNVAWVWN